MVALGVKPPAIVMLQPIDADADAEEADDQRPVILPLFGDRPHDVRSGRRPVRTAGRLDFDEQQCQRDCEDRIGESFEAFQPALRTLCGSNWPIPASLFARSFQRAV